MGVADLIVQNANVLTVDDGRPRAEAFAVANGAFLAVGSTDEVRDLAGGGTEEVDLKGKTVVPGFIDAHLHALSSGIAHVRSVDCDLRSIGEIQEALRQRASETPKGEWVRGFKFDDTKTAESRFLRRADLDAVSVDHPIYVSHRAGHHGFVNSRALDVAGLDRDTPDPAGGEFERDPGTGELTGVAAERAMGPFSALIPPVTEADRRAGLVRICEMFNAAGLTSVHDAIVSDRDLVTYQKGYADGDLTLRVNALMWHTHLDALISAGIRGEFGDAMLRIGGIKMLADGAIAGRSAWLSQPYEGTDSDYGIRVMAPEELEPLAEKIHKAGFQICVHANGDAAIDMTLTAYEKAVASSPRPDSRHRIEHCTLVNPDLLDRMKRLGCVATPFCTYVYYHGEKMRFYGEERLKWMFAQRSFIDNGIVSTGSTDYVPGPFEPLTGIQSCVTRTDSNGKVWGANQRITVAEALRCYTLNGAYASFEENVKGSITPGKLADFVVLGEDITKTDTAAIKDIPIEMTVVGGRVVHRA